MKLLRLFSIGIFIALLLSSCANEKSTSSEAIEKDLLDAYMVVKYGEDRSLWPAQADMGYYYIPLRSTGNVTKPQDDSWIKYDISSISQDGILIYTSVADVAKDFNTFSYFTHYTPEYYIMGDNYGYITNGLADAMKNYIAVGDSVRLIMYPSLIGLDTYLPSINTGKPVTMDITVKNVVPLPLETEESELVSFKENHYSTAVSLKGESGNDTTNIYFQELIPPTGDVIVEDKDTVRVFYTGRYLDGYMFDTNIIDSAKKYNIYSYNPTKYDPEGLRVIIGNSEVVNGFEAGIKNMKLGSSAVVFFTSAWGYGNAGDSQKGMKPYTSLCFHIWLEKVNKGTTE
ncbi:MAG: FKBP-type peptidyl-prolyl cis-trans isomerase [Prevotellaceae bacterium]|jgi:hypothetical protein|nr:FKBP-type peptidyl-prolyl cis-trans isomerase [Prevotellaceae bacterium]